MIDREQFEADFSARIKDEVYSSRLAQLIDEFYTAGGGLRISEIIEDPIIKDMVEILYRINTGNTYTMATTLFMLGIWLGSRREAVFPITLQ